MSGERAVKSPGSLDPGGKKLVFRGLLLRRIWGVGGEGGVTKDNRGKPEKITKKIRVFSEFQTNLVLSLKVV